MPTPPPFLPAVKELARRVRATSPLGDYATPLSVVGQLVRCEPAARVLVKLREWLPDLKDVTGRGIEVREGYGGSGGGWAAVVM